MQYIPGRNVRQLVMEAAAAQSALSIAIQVTDALAVAMHRNHSSRHQAGNVMVNTKRG